MFKFNLFSSMSKLLGTVALLVMAAGLLSACDLAQNQLKTDRAANMDFQDFRDGLSPRPEPEDAKYAEGIPSLESYVVPPAVDLRPMPLVSISVNQTVPLRDALFELARKAQYDIELDPNIDGSIIFTAHNKPFDQVIARIAKVAGLRYRFEDGILSVEEDTPYSKTYKIDYINFIRTATSKITTDISVVEAQDSAGASGGSGFTASNSSESNFWTELEQSLQQLISSLDSSTMRTRGTPSLTVASQPAPVQPVVTTADGAVNPDGTAAAPQATINVQSLPPVDADVGTGTNVDGTTGGVAAAAYSINKHAGLINIFANERIHEQVESYLKDLKESVTAQVLIEAKVLEVALNDEYSAGIDWDEFEQKTINGDLSFVRAPLFSGTEIDSTTNSFDLTIGGGFDGVFNLQALSRYGTVRALSSPRLTVLNNQSAIMNVTSNVVFFDLEVDINQSEGTITTSVESEVESVPEGVIINVQPSIDLERRKVSMALRPTITNVEGFAEDPGVPLSIAGFLATAGGAIPDDLVESLNSASSDVPILGIQEFDTVIQVGDGQSIVIGGLMQDEVQTIETGVPVLSEVPLLGNAFKSHTDQIEKKELVIFLKATILGDGGYVHKTDKELYKSFGSDRRPFKL